MSSAEFTPEVGALEQDYQILTELHHSADSQTFLARHQQLNRDVTITIMNAPTPERVAALERFAAGVERVKALRHPNVVPVLETRRLNAAQFAVIRARVRGSSLEQLVTALGPIPLQRVGSILEEVRQALVWAASNGLVDRYVSQDSMTFQQGSGRVLVSFEPAPGARSLAPDSCEDARTIGTLGWEMLSAQRLDDRQLKSLSELRPDLSRSIVSETNALVHCWPAGPPRDLVAYIGILTATTPELPVGPVRPTPRASQVIAAVPHLGDAPSAPPAMPGAARRSPAAATPVVGSAPASAAVASAAVPNDSAPPPNAKPPSPPKMPPASSRAAVAPLPTGGGFGQAAASAAQAPLAMSQSGSRRRMSMAGLATEEAPSIRTRVLSAAAVVAVLAMLGFAVFKLEHTPVPAANQALVPKPKTDSGASGDVKLGADSARGGANGRAGASTAAPATGERGARGKAKKK